MFLHFSNIKHSELASLSNASYTNTTIEGWKIYKVYETQNYFLKDYNGIAYLKNKQIVISHKGTSHLNDIWNDLQYILKQVPDYYEKARTFTKSVIDQAEQDGYEVLVHTGHSLGGIIAKLLTVKENYKSIVFETPGILELVKDEISNINRDLSITYNTAPNSINTFGSHVFPILRLYPDFDLNASFYTLNQHAIEGIIKQFDPHTGKPKVFGIIPETVFWPQSEIGVSNLATKGISFISGHWSSGLSTSPLEYHNPYLYHLEHEEKSYNYLDRYSEQKDIRKNCIDNVEIVAGDSGSKISGGTACDEKIQSGYGDDEIWLFSGNDIIKDSAGNDTYVIVPHFFLEKNGVTEIHDEDKVGQLFLEVMRCRIQDTDYSEDDKGFVFYPNNHEECVMDNIYRESEVSQDNVEEVKILFKKDCKNWITNFFGFGECDLLIEYRDNNYGTNKNTSDIDNDINPQIVIKDYKNGDLGIYLHSQEENSSYIPASAVMTTIGALALTLYYTFSSNPLLIGNVHDIDSIV